MLNNNTPQEKNQAAGKKNKNNNNLDKIKYFFTERVKDLIIIIRTKSKGLSSEIDDEFDDECFTKKIKSDINILLETWKDDSKETRIPAKYVCFNNMCSLQLTTCR